MHCVSTTPPKWRIIIFHGKKYNLTNYSERNIFLPMNSVEEWERVICAASQGLRNKVDCTQWTVAGFPHENGREAADPFGGKDLNTFEYQKSTGPSLGIKIDLIAEWLVTQARGCPSGCGNSARNLSGSVRCNTGNDADCTDPKPAILTRSCGKTADCPTYTGTWIQGSCPSGCGQSTGYKIVGVSCSGGNCNPSTKPSTRRYCWATPACAPVNCQVSSWGGWTDTSNWGSCSANCGGGTQTKSQRRTRTITTQPQHGGSACPALTETRSVSQSCNTHSCPCGVDLYRVNGNCVWVGNGFYSPDNDDSRYNCTIKPAQNSIWTGSGGGSDNCPWSCKSGHTKNSSSTACVLDCHDDKGKSCGQGGTLACDGTTCENEVVCPANKTWDGDSCEYKGTWIITQPNNCPASCGNSVQTLSGSVRCSTGNDADCPQPKPTTPSISCGATPACPVACLANPPKKNAVWLDGHGDFEPKCNWKCDATRDYVWNSVLKECRETQTPKWIEGNWGACNAGTKTRSVTCSTGNDADCTDPKPRETSNEGCVIANPYYEFVCDSGAWTPSGRCSTLDECDHDNHTLGDKCCTKNSSSPEGICRN